MCLCTGVVTTTNCLAECHFQPTREETAKVTSAATGYSMLVARTDGGYHFHSVMVVDTIFKRPAGLTCADAHPLPSLRPPLCPCRTSCSSWRQGTDTTLGCARTAERRRRGRAEPGLSGIAPYALGRARDEAQVHVLNFTYGYTRRDKRNMPTSLCFEPRWLILLMFRLRDVVARTRHCAVV